MFFFFIVSTSSLAKIMVRNFFLSWLSFLTVGKKIGKYFIADDLLRDSQCMSAFKML
jgi:hypothetical protein